MLQPKKTQLYTIEWYVDGSVKDELFLTDPQNKAITKWRISKLKNSTHTTGLLIPKIVKS